MISQIFKIGGLLCLCSMAFAQNALEANALDDLRKSQRKLTAQRTSQSADRQALSLEITELQNQLLTKRRQADISRRSIADQDAFLRNLKNKDYSSNTVVAGFNDGLRSYGIKLSTRFLPGSELDERLDPAFEKSTDANADLAARLAILELGLERIEQSLGGSEQAAKVSTADAKLISGKVISFGPARWFQSDDQKVAGGYHIARSGQIANLDKKTADTANELFSGKETDATIDITGGKARALAEVRSGPIDLIKKGGAWVYPIILLAFVALFCAIFKFIELRNIKDPTDTEITQFAKDFIVSSTSEKTTQVAALRHPVSQILPSLMDALSTRSIELAEEILYERLIPVREKLRSWLPFVAVTAAISPLLGLLGTVSGLIKTFSVIAIEGTGEAQSISGGISEALITTLFGLTVAIPAFMAHALLSRRARGIEQTSERLALVFLNEVRKSQIQVAKK